MRHVQDLITAGSVYQVNVTTRARATVRGDLTALYGDLVHAQGAAHNALLHLDGRSSIISISPELFLDWAPPLVRCRPMKGTARRTEDDSSRRTLLTDLFGPRPFILLIASPARGWVGFEHGKHAGTDLRAVVTFRWVAVFSDSD